MTAETEALRLAIMKYPPSKPRTMALTKIEEAEMWLEKCDQRYKLSQSMPAALRALAAPQPGDIIVLSPDELITKLKTTKYWQLITNTDGGLIIYVRSEDAGNFDQIFYGPNPMDMSHADAAMFLDQVRRLQRQHNQVTDP